MGPWTLPETIGLRGHVQRLCGLSSTDQLKGSANRSKCLSLQPRKFRNAVGAFAGDNLNGRELLIYGGKYPNSIVSRRRLWAAGTGLVTKLTKKRTLLGWLKNLF